MTATTGAPTTQPGRAIRRAANRREAAALRKFQPVTGGLTFVDLFCGAGGSSLGLTGAGMELKLAANHWERAIETHAANFRGADHWCEDINKVDMRRLPAAHVLWASPLCTEASPAGGRTGTRRPKNQGDLFEAEGHVEQAGYERTRATFHDVIRAAEVRRYPAVLVENVVDVVEKWELFDWWVQGMMMLRYRMQIVCVSAAHVGGEDNPPAPQWRDRIYLVFTLEGIPLPDVAPRPLAPCDTCGEDVRAVQSWKPGVRRVCGQPVGKYRAQYTYVCPHNACRHAQVEPYVLPAAAAIDWSDLGCRIGDRAALGKRPLVPNTLRRIQAGLDRYAPDPTMITVTHGDDDPRAYPAFAAPLPTRTSKIGDGFACPPLLVPSGGTWRDTATSAGEPMPTRTTRDSDGLLVPPGAFYVKNYGGAARPADLVRSVDHPFGTITTSDHHGLVVPYYRTGKAHTTREPLTTLTTKDRHGFIPRVAVDLADCWYRMLKPREHLRSQCFPDSYIVTGNGGEQTMQAGNAVAANVARWIGRQVAAALGGGA